MSMFRSLNNEKIGQILNYLASNIEHLSMTKTLKLLYILDETSIKETGTPFTWLDYKVWEMGPVAIDIYNEIKRDEIICYKGKELKSTEYVNIECIQKQDREEIYLTSKSEFDKSIFNQYELDLLYMTVFKFGNWKAPELIKYLHEEGSLWHKMVQTHNLEEHFETYSKITNHSIEFTELIEEDQLLMMAYQSAVDYFQFKDSLLNHAQAS
jgi:uncharacterized phage-associated protein